MKASIIMLSFEDLSKDPRIRRHILALKDNYDLTVIGRVSPQIEGVKFIESHKDELTLIKKIIRRTRLLTRCYEKFYWSNQEITGILKILSQQKYDLVIANDMDTLPLAVALQRKDVCKKILFDAHEYAPKEFEDVLYWRLLYKPYKTYLCKKYLPFIAKGITVCQGIAEEYQRQFDTSFEVITNASKYMQASPKRVDEKIRMVFHGAVTPSRNLENLIKIMDLVDERYYLDLYLVGDKSYIQKLQHSSKHNSHIRICKPVPFEHIFEMLRVYDIGLYLLEPNSFNNKMALPNKLFEFIQARLMVAIGPSPEMKRYVEKYQCGIVSEDFSVETLASQLNVLDDKIIMQYKKNAERMAQIECAENNAVKIKAIIEDILRD